MILFNKIKRCIKFWWIKQQRINHKLDLYEQQMNEVAIQLNISPKQASFHSLETLQKLTRKRKCAKQVLYEGKIWYCSYYPFEDMYILNISYPQNNYPPFSETKRITVFEYNYLKKNMISIYTDGSFNNNDLPSWGYVMYDENGVILFEDRGVTTEQEFVAMRNVGGEIIAAYKALEKARLEGFTDVTLFHDYDGIGFWPDKKWKAKKPETNRYVRFVDKIRETVNVTFISITGHSGITGNDYADSLAKQAYNEYKYNISIQD